MPQQQTQEELEDAAVAALGGSITISSIGPEALTGFGGANQNVMTVNVPGKPPMQVYRPSSEPGALFPPSAATQQVPGTEQPSVFDQPKSVGETVVQEGFVNPAKQAWSQFTQGGANLMHLGANLTQAINQDLTDMGLGPAEQRKVLTTVENWFRGQQAGGEQTAAQLAGGRTDFPSQVNRALAGGIANLPPYIAASATPLGPIAGMAAIGGLENVNLGPGATVKGMAKGAAYGTVMHVMGPAGRPMRITGNTALAYTQAKQEGASDEEALAAAVTGGIMGEMGPGGGPGARYMARNIPRVPENVNRALGDAGVNIKIPPMFPNRNSTQKDALQWMAQQGVHVNAPAASGSRFLGGVQRVTEATPFGGMVGESGRQKTMEGVRELTGRLEEQAKPEIPPGEFYDKFYEAENAPESSRQVPSGKLDAEGKPVMEDMQMPVPVGRLKGMLRPIFEQMQWMPAADRNASAGYAALAKFLSGPNNIPASQAETGLGGIKTMAREADGRNRGIAKKIVPELQALIDQTVRQIGGEDAVSALQQGRKAAAKQAGADWLSEVFTRARAEGEYNRQDAVWNRWLNLPEDAKRTMFSPKQAADLNRFFLATKSLFRNVNPSGTAQVSAIAHLFEFFQHPYAVTGEVLGGAALAKLLDSKFGVKLLTEGITIGGKDPARTRQIQEELRNIIGEEPGEPPEGPGGGGPPDELPGGGGGGGGLRFGGQHELGREPINPPGGGEGPPPPPPGTGGAGGGRAAGGAPQTVDEFARNLYGKPYEELTGSELARIHITSEEQQRVGRGGAGTGKGEPLSIYDSLQKAGDEARERFRKNMGTTMQAGFGFYGGKDVLTTIAADVAKGVKTHGAKINAAVKDMGEWGAGRIYGGYARYPEWKEQMLKDAGELSPEAQDFFGKNAKRIYASAQHTLKKRMSEMGGDAIGHVKKIFEYADAGMDAKEWYDHARPQLQRIFGPHTDLFLNFLAATSPQTKVAPNVEQAMQAFQEHLAGRPFSTNFEEHVKNLERAGRGEPLSGPKVTSFIANLLGDKIRVTVDTWVAQAYGLGIKSKAHIEALAKGEDAKAGLSDPQYRFLDYAITQAARERGIDPRQMQAAIWVGIKRMEGNPKYTHEPFGVVVRDYLKANPDIAKLIERAVGEAREAMKAR